MATKINKKVVRESSFSYQGRPIIVELEEGGKMVSFRQKGRRTRGFRTSIEQLWWFAAKSSIEKE